MKPASTDDSESTDTPFLSKLAERSLPFLLHIFNNREPAAGALAEYPKNKKAHIVTLCAHCKSELDELGYWQSGQASRKRSRRVQLTHGICPSCTREHFPEVDLGEAEMK